MERYKETKIAGILGIVRKCFFINYKSYYWSYNTQSGYDC